MVRFGFVILREVPPSCYGLAKVLRSIGSIVTLAHHPYWRSFHTFAYLICKLLEDSGPFASIPLTARSSRSFCRGANFDIGVVSTSTDEQDNLFTGHGLIPYVARESGSRSRFFKIGACGGIRLFFNSKVCRGRYARTPVKSLTGWAYYATDHITQMNPH